MHREQDDEAWRAIVENFGERAALPDEPDGPGEHGRPDASAPASDPRTDEAPDAAPVPPEDLLRPGPAEPPAVPAAPVDDEERFVPPEPGPLPVPTPDRGIAWLGVFGAPVVLLVSLLLGIDLPTWVGWLMVAWFVGGFVYLVHQMPREPREPWDDGSRV